MARANWRVLCHLKIYPHISSYCNNPLPEHTFVVWKLMKRNFRAIFLIHFLSTVWNTAILRHDRTRLPYVNTEMILPPALDASFPRRSPQIIPSDRHFGIRRQHQDKSHLGRASQSDSLAYVIGPLLWGVLSRSLHVKASLVTHAVCTWRCWTLPFLRFERERMQRVNEIIYEHLQWNFASFNIKINWLTSISSDEIDRLPKYFHPPHWNNSLFISCTITEFCVTSFLALDTCGQKYCQTLSYRPTRQFQLFLSDFPSNFKLPGF